MFSKLRRKIKEYNEIVELRKERDSSTEFTENERIIPEIITKCDFTQNVYPNCEIEKYYYNNLELKYQKHWSYDSADSFSFTISRRDNNHQLHEIKLGNAKLEILQKMIADKKLAYVNESTISAMNCTDLPSGTCSYCGMQNAKDTVRCINCGAILKSAETF